METAQRPRTPAEIYDELFVPALFRQWGPVVADAAGLRPGQTVLDIACGTGALTLAALDRVGPGGNVTGLDANPDMLSVARLKSAAVEWIEGLAENLPFDGASFDAVVSQFGLMFFTDKVAAFREIMRVLRPDGCFAVAVCDALENSPGYNILAGLLQKLFGREIADSFRAPFVLGNPAALRAICAEAAIGGAVVSRLNGAVRFASVAHLIASERACVWTLGGLLNDEQFAVLIAEAEDAFRPFVSENGSVSFEMPALVVKASRGS